MARNPAGWKARMLAPNASTDSCGGSSDPPALGASQASTVNSSDSPSSCRRQVVGPSPTHPWRRTSGGPSPARS